jgi:hypothetical protein
MQAIEFSSHNFYLNTSAYSIAFSIAHYYFIRHLIISIREGGCGSDVDDGAGGVRCDSPAGEPDVDDGGGDVRCDSPAGEPDVDDGGGDVRCDSSSDSSSDCSFQKWLEGIDETFIDAPPLPPGSEEHELDDKDGVAEGDVDADESDDPEPWLSFKLGSLGKLVLNDKNNNFSLAAHCPRHGALCRINRTLKAGNKKLIHRGRPIGFLICWLREAGDYKSKQLHIKAGRDRSLAKWSRPKRKHARAWAKEQPVLANSLAWERKARPEDGESDGEPLECPD